MDCRREVHSTKRDLSHRGYDVGNKEVQPIRGSKIFTSIRSATREQWQESHIFMTMDMVYITSSTNHYTTRENICTSIPCLVTRGSQVKIYLKPLLSDLGQVAHP